MFNSAIVATCCLYLAVPNFAWALPIGEQVGHGRATFERSGNNLIIRQGSDKLITKWGSFSIGTGEKTQFIQPTKNSAALNRVIGGSRSIIDGELSANGKVVLINPAGVTVGPTGVVNVNSFTASTQDITDQEFIGGGDLLYKGASQETVENLGTIRASGGDAILIAKHVQNSGTLEAKKGVAALVGATEVLVKPKGEERIFIKPASEKGATVTQTATGRIAAASAEIKAAGNPYATAINLEGLVDVQAVSQTATCLVKINSGAGDTQITGTVKARRANQSGGTILLAGNNVNLKPGSVLDASGVAKGGSVRAEAANLLRGEGTILAQGGTLTGGTIELYGKTIELMTTALVDASSTVTGGGQIYIGGGYQGKELTKPNADNVFVAKGAQILANAGTKGTGGKVIAWGNQNNLFYGSIEAKGGTVKGDGGFVEVSSPGQLAYRGTTNLSAVNGKMGTLLLDPTSIVIISATNADPIYSNPGVTTGMDNTSPPVWTSVAPGNAAFTSYLMTQDLIAALDTANVVVQTTANNAGNNAEALPNLHALTGNSNSGTIYVADDIGWGLSGITTSLTLSAHNDIVIASSIINGSGGNITLLADSDGVGGGAVFVGVGGLLLDDGFGTTTYAQSKGISIEAYGAINITGSQVLVLGGGGKFNDLYARVGAGNFLGNINLPIPAIGNNATINVTANGGNWAGSDLINYTGVNGAIMVIGGSTIGSYAQIGHGGSGNHLRDNAGVTAAGADITLNAQNGGVTVVGNTTDAEFAYAQIGHGGSKNKAGDTAIIDGTISGDITINSGANTGGFLVVIGGRNKIGSVGRDNYAQIGHGGAYSQWTRGAQGDITLDLRNGTGDLVFVSGGGNDNAYAQIGHGGTETRVGTLATASQFWKGDISLTGFTTSTATSTFGGVFQLGFADPANLIVGAGSYSQIGHGGRDFFANAVSEIGGNITVDITGPTSGLDAGIYGSANGSDAYAQIGHGGGSSTGRTILQADQFGGDITVNFKNVNKLTLSESLLGKGSNGFSYSQIGHGGANSEITANTLGIGGLAHSNILVSLPKGDLFLRGGSSVGTEAQIGHGGYLSQIVTSALVQTDDQANITVTAGGDINVNEGYSDTALFDTSYALIGHGGGMDDSSSVLRSTWSKVAGGNVTANLDLAAGGDILVGFDVDHQAGGDIAHGKWAAIGHQINWNDGTGLSDAVEDLTANIVINNGGDLVVGRANSGNTTVHQIGHNAIEINGDAIADIIVGLGGELTISKSEGSKQSISFIGHGGKGADLIANSFKAGIGIGFSSSSGGARTHQILNTTETGFAGVGHLALVYEVSPGVFDGGNFSSVNGINAAITIGDKGAGSNTLILNNGSGFQGSFVFIGHLIQTQLLTGNDASISDLHIKLEIETLEVNGDFNPALIGHSSTDTQIFGTADLKMDIAARESMTLTAGGKGKSLIGHGYFGELKVNADADFTAQIKVQAKDILLGGDGPTQIGHAWTNVSAVGDRFDAAIQVNADNDVTITSSSGIGSDGYALIGHGGNFFGAPAHWVLAGGASSVNEMGITVTAGNDLTMTLGEDPNAFAQIGHGFKDSAATSAGLDLTNANATLSANIVVSAGGTISLNAPVGVVQDSASYLQIGHGGAGSLMTSTGRLISTIDVTAGQGLTANLASVDAQYIQIGHGGKDSALGLTAATNSNAADKAITVNVTNGDLTLQAGAATNGYVQIGHLGEGGGLAKDDILAADISVLTNDGDIIVNSAGTKGVGYAKIGHDGVFASLTSGFIAGKITANSSRDVILNAQDGGMIQVGNYHQSSPPDPAIIGNSDITITAARDMLLSAGGSANSTVYIGHFGELRLALDPSATDNLTLAAGRDLTTDASNGVIAALSLGSNALFGAGRNVTLGSASASDFTVVSAEKLLTIVVDYLSGVTAGPGSFRMDSNSMIGSDGIQPGMASIDELRIYTSTRGNNTIGNGATFWIQNGASADSYTFLAGPTTGVTNPNGNWTYRPLYNSAQREQWNTVWNGTPAGGGTFTAPFTVFYKDNSSVVPPLPPTPPPQPPQPNPSTPNSGIVSSDFPGIGQLLGQEFDAPEEYVNDSEKYYKRKNFQFRVRAKAFAEALRPLGFTLKEHDILSGVKKKGQFTIERGSFLSEPQQSRSNYEFVAR